MNISHNTCLEWVKTQFDTQVGLQGDKDKADAKCSLQRVKQEVVTKTVAQYFSTVWIQQC